MEMTLGEKKRHLKGSVRCEQRHRHSGARWGVGCICVGQRSWRWGEEGGLRPHQCLTGGHMGNSLHVSFWPAWCWWFFSNKIFKNQILHKSTFLDLFIFFEKKKKKIRSGNTSLGLITTWQHLARRWVGNIQVITVAIVTGCISHWPVSVLPEISTIQITLELAHCVLKAPNKMVMHCRGGERKS